MGNIRRIAKKIIDRLASRLPNEILVYRGGPILSGRLPWFTEDPVEAAKYGPVLAYYLRTDNPASVDGGFTPSLLRESGYDAARFDNPMSREGDYDNQAPQWVPLDMAQIRLVPEDDQPD